eukprot:scaffold174504_cov63-Attheya_sp.AAC.8
MPVCTKRWSQKKQTKREVDGKKARTVESKKRRRRKWYEKLAKKQVEMKKSKHDGDYGHGKGFTVSVLGSSSSSTITASTNVHVNKKRHTSAHINKNQLPQSQIQCCFCSKIGHTTTRSSDCDRNPAKALMVHQLYAVHPEAIVAMGGCGPRVSFFFCHIK